MLGAHSAFVGWIVINLLFNYIMGVVTRPGRPPLIAYAAGGEVRDSGALRSARTTRDGAVRWCNACNGPKPARTHHCSVCKQCVMKMDHHCPWFNGCIGHFNHRYFFLFMAYTWVGCVYVALVTLGPFQNRSNASRAAVASAVNEANAAGDAHHAMDHLQFHALRVLTGRMRLQVTFVFVMTSAVTFALGLLLAWHVVLVSRAETTLEFYSNGSKKSAARRRGEVFVNPYSRGVRQNWRDFFAVGYGGRSWFSVLWPSTHGPAGDGVTWPLQSHKRARGMDIV